MNLIWSSYLILKNKNTPSSPQISCTSPSHPFFPLKPRRDGSINWRSWERRNVFYGGFWRLGKRRWWGQVRLVKIIQIDRGKRIQNWIPCDFYGKKKWNKLRKKGEEWQNEQIWEASLVSNQWIGWGRYRVDLCELCVMNRLRTLV